MSESSYIATFVELTEENNDNMSEWLGFLLKFEHDVPIMQLCGFSSTPLRVADLANTTVHTRVSSNMENVLTG
jgi:hypothetical protein